MNSGSNNIKGYALREPVSNKVSIQMTSYQSTAPTTPLEMKKKVPCQWMNIIKYRKLVVTFWKYTDTFKIKVGQMQL